MSGLCSRCTAERLGGCGDGRGYPACQEPLGLSASSPDLIDQLRSAQFPAPKGYEGDRGTKGDHGKNRLDLLPFRALDEVGAVMTFGAEKYGDHNWKGLSVTRLMGAALRHGFAWLRGEDNDPETGRSHLAHMACCVLMSLEQVLARPAYDDRDKENA